MADFASSSSSSSALPEPSSAIAVPLAVDDSNSDDCCSICLELFNSDDPATITSCKHEYHLHCILEWSQRSKECPICWQSLFLKDPGSQELLDAVEKERRWRSRNTLFVAAPITRYFPEDEDSDHDSSDEFAFDERIMHHLAGAASRARFRGRERQRHSGMVSPEALFYTSANVPEQEHESSSDECHNLTPRSSMDDSPVSVTPTVLNSGPTLPVAPTNAVDGSVAFRPRVLYSQSPSVRLQKPSLSEVPTFSDSIKSKWSAASARYKESFSKGTKGLKEKLLARSTSVKELSKGVQREMSASFAGVARMIERIDLTPKRTGVSPDSSHGAVASNASTKDKAVLEGFLAQSLTKNDRKVSDEISSSDAMSHPTVVIPGRVVVSRAQVSGSKTQ